MAQLAIKGHATRGREVIEILVMLGGVDFLPHNGCGKGIYFIDPRDNMIYFQPKNIIGDLTIFTIEEFLGKYPYEIGDKVTHLDYESPLEIVGMKWENDSIKYEVYTNDYGYWFSVDELQPYKEQETKKVSTEFFDKYCKKCGSQRCTAEGEWLEGCEHYKEETMEELRIDFPEGYGYAGIENKQVIFTKIKPQYPKTYEECCEILDWNHRDYDRVGYNSELLCKLQVLLLCRDAYWKMAGEQMGLGKPWEPDWNNDLSKYYISFYGNKLDKGIVSYSNKILAFPTEEIRDIFFENFKELIELCKVLL